MLNNARAALRVAADQTAVVQAAVMKFVLIRQANKVASQIVFRPELSFFRPNYRAAMVLMKQASSAP